MSVRSETLFNKEQMDRMVALYKDGIGTPTIATMIGGQTTKSNIARILKIRGIPLRKDARRPHAHVDINERARNIITGLLLGDGSLFPVDERNGRQYSSGFIIAQSARVLEFIEWLRAIFDQSGIKTYLVNRNHRTPSITLSTAHGQEFTELRSIWYPNGKKVVPQDIKLSRDAVLMWYISDGTKYKTNAITIYTNSFTFCECERLRLALLNTWDINSSVKQRIPGLNSWSTRPHEPVPILYIPVSEARKFFKAIGPCPVQCYAYKWPRE